MLVPDKFELAEPGPALAPERVLRDGHGSPAPTAHEDISLRQARAHHYCV